MSLLNEIDKLRAEARDQSDIRHLESKFWGPGYHEAAEAADVELARLENEIEVLLMKRIALPDCPYCPGKLEPTPTKLVYKCDLCRATTLPGTMEAVNHG